MAEHPHDELHLFKCWECKTIFQGCTNFRRHVRNASYLPPFRCGECEEDTYEHFTSLMRHIRTAHYHAIQPNQEGIAEGGNCLLEHNFAGAGAIEAGAIGGEDNGAEDLAAGGDILEADPAEDDNSSDDDTVIDLARSAGEMVLNLRQTGNVTGSAIERFQTETYRMIKDVSKLMKRKVKAFLVETNQFTPEAKNMLKGLVIEDPFHHIKTLKQQLSYFSKEFGLVKPETKFLQYRIDYRLNPESAQYEPTRIPMSFEYVSVTKTLTALLNNPIIRELIEAETPSEDGVLRTYLDGSRSKSNPLIMRFPKILRIQIYWDDIEVVNPLGSKTSIHKIAAFYFSLQNLPAVESSQLSSVYLLALAFSNDLKIEGCFEKILAPFLYELRKLESDRGVMTMVNGQPYCLRATLTMLCADTLAAHEILGFLSPSANYFCRKCMISRHDFRRNLNAMGEKRTRAMFDNQVEMVRQNRRYSTQCGVRTSCPLHLAKHFDATEDAAFDILHDLLEGVCHWVISLTLRAFICKYHYFNLVQFNSRIESFSYGIPDAKNKPSANFSEDSLKGSKLKQKGSQMWCLIRIFGFLVADVPEDNPHLKLVNLLQSILLIAFAWEARDSDADRLEHLIEEHHSLFQELHMTDDANIIDELSDSGEEEVPNDPNEDEMPRDAATAGKKWKKVQPGNKLHQMKHLPGDLRKYGSLIRYWCMRYEGRHHIFCKYGSCCCNFINIIKSMAQMFQISTLAGMQKTCCRADEIELQSPHEISVHQCSLIVRNLLFGLGLRANDIVVEVTAVKVAGEDYRPGLFVLTEASGPTFAVIKQIFAFKEQVFLVLSQWHTVGFKKRYCAYEVEPTADNVPSILPHRALARHGAFAPWNPMNQRTTFIAPRSIIF